MDFSQGGALCFRAEDVAAYIAGALSESEVCVLEAHAADCTACRELLSALVRIADSADGRPEAASSGHDIRVAGTAREGAPSLADSMIGRYEIREQLGVGGMGVVHAAYDPQLKRRVALKILRDDLLAADARASLHERLLREARAMAQLAHPNVVAVYEVDRHDERVFIAMELVEGETLAAWLAARPRGWREVVSVFVAAGQGLAAAHAAGLVHRDFKPANVLIGRDGRARVTDFGLAHAGGAESPGPNESPADRDRDGGTATPIGALVGTPLYMAPEQFRGEPADARSDQFSFCVALYRALYDAHPFPGATMGAAAAAVAAGRVLPPRPATQVPRRLHRVVMRGLSVAPADRYPAMSALLRELEDLSRRLSLRRSRIAAGVAVVALAGAGIMSYAATREPVVEVCGGGQSKLAELWNADERVRMRSAFSATGVSYAADTWSRVEPVLDADATAWTTMYRDACEATRVRGEQSELLLDRRMACLDAHRRELEQLTRLFRAPDAGVIEHAIQAARGLSSIEGCGDLAALSRPMAPPPAASTAAVSAARDTLAEVHVLDDAGKYDAGLALIGKLAADGVAHDYLPLRAEVSFWTGRLNLSKRALPAALPALEDAIWAAEASGHEEITTAALSAAVAVLADLDRFKEAHDMIRRGEAALLRVAAPALTRAEFHVSACAAYYGEGRYAEAQAQCEQGLDLRRRELAPDHPDLARALHSLAAVLQTRGNIEQPLGYFREALAIQEKALGPEHPRLVSTLRRLGLAEVKLGRPDDAMAAFQRALAIGERAFGRDSKALSDVLVNIGYVLEQRGQYTDATKVFQRSLTIIESTVGPQHSQVAERHINLASVLHLQKDYAGALEHYRRALSILEATVGTAHPTYAAALLNICSAELERKRPRDALPWCQRGLAVLEHADGSNDRGIADALVGMIDRVYAANGMMPEAIAALDRGIARWPKNDPTAAPAIAEGELTLAQTIWEYSPPDRARARALATRARDRFRDAGAKYEAKRIEADAWLATHQARRRG